MSRFASPRFHQAGEGFARLLSLRCWLGVLTLVCSFLLLGALPAKAQIVVDRPLEVVGNGNGNSVQIRLCNLSTTESVLVGLATYEIPTGVGPGAGGIPTEDQLDKQVLFDFKERVLRPGQCAVLTVRVPPCGQADAYQADAFGNGVITKFSGSDYYMGRLLAGEIFGCDD